MKSIGVATYTIRLRPKRGTEYELLGEFDGRTSLRKFLHGFLRSLETSHANDELNKHLLRARGVMEDESDLRGFLDAGEYGFGAEGVNVQTLAKSYKRKADDAELIPFYLRFHLPDANDTGLLLLQRFGAQGVFHSLTEQLQQYFRDRHPDYILEMNRLVPIEMLKHLLDGQLKEITLTTYSIPNDIADKYKYLGNTREAGTMTVTFRAKKNGFLKDPPWVKKLRKGALTVVEVPQDLGGTPSKLRIKVAYNGKTRTLDMTQPDTMAPYIDATGQVKLATSGHPTEDSIEQFCVELRDSLLSQLGRK